jgi:hypothetical protein
MSFIIKTTPTCHVHLHTASHYRPTYPVTKVKLTFTKETARKVDEIVCDYFKFKSDNNKKMVKIILSHCNPHPDYIEFYQAHKPQIIHGLYIQGFKDILYEGDLKEPIQLLHKQQSVAVSVRSALGNDDYHMSAKELQNKSDISLLAFFNSEFKSYRECHLSFGSTRTFNKIKIKESIDE